MFATSDVVWQGLIGAACTMALAWMAMRTKTAVEKTGGNAKMAADRAASEVRGVKSDLAVNQTETSDKLDTIHTLVNHSSEVMLADNLELKKNNLTLIKRLAIIAPVPGDEEQIRAGEDAILLAERRLAEHVEKQSRVDAKNADKEQRSIDG